MTATGKAHEPSTQRVAGITNDPATDLKKFLVPLLNPPLEPVFVDVPELGYLMIDGHGAVDEWEGSPANELQRAFAALYPVVYTIKFALKPAGKVVPILPLEALWFTGENREFDVDVPKDRWAWTVLMAVPDVVSTAVFAGAVAEVRRKKGNSDALDRLRFERWREGRCAQVMHIGPYLDEGPTIERLHAFIAAAGCKRRGAHHEIYLGDPRRADPAKLKTVLRQSVE
jgi:hypothetical protein